MATISLITSQYEEERLRSIGPNTSLYVNIKYVENSGKADRVAWQ